MSINIVIVGSQTFVGPDGWRLPAGARAWEWWRPRRSWVATAKGKPFLGKPWLLREITGKSQGTPPFFGKHQGNDREISEKTLFWGGEMTGKWPNPLFQANDQSDASTGKLIDSPIPEDLSDLTWQGAWPTACGEKQVQHGTINTWVFHGISWNLVGLSGILIGFNGI